MLNLNSTLTFMLCFVVLYHRPKQTRHERLLKMYAYPWTWNTAACTSFYTVSYFMLVWFSLFIFSDRVVQHYRRVQRGVLARCLFVLEIMYCLLGSLVALPLAPFLLLCLFPSLLVYLFYMLIPTCKSHSLQRIVIVNPQES